MSQNNEDDDINFQELVGNLLSSHNENLNDESIHEPEQGHEQEHLDLPDLHTAEDDLVSVVANAMQNMEVDEGVDHQLHEDINTTRQEEGVSETTYNDDEARQHQEWAQILRQGILEAERTTDEKVADNQPHISGDNLDDEDENLRRAILESLNELNGPAKIKESKKSSKKKKKDKDKDKKLKKHDKKADRKSDKKSDKKSSKKSEKKTAGSKSKSTTVTKKPKATKQATNVQKDDDDLGLLNFEDVIQSFLREGEEAGKKQQPKIDNNLEADEIVEATLKAFEKELLNVTEKKKKPVRTTTKKETTKKSKPSENKNIINRSSIAAKKPKQIKSKKAQEVLPEVAPASAFEEDDFSKALADVVERVVNSSLVDTETTKPPTKSIKPTEKVVTKEVKTSKNKSPKKAKEQKPTKTKKDEKKQKSEKKKKSKTSTTDEPFDMNTIMKNAMSLAFQDQTAPELDTSVLDDFNKGLGEISISDILAPSNLAQKKKTISKDKKQKEDNLEKDKKERRKSTQQLPKESKKQKDTGPIFVPVEPARSSVPDEIESSITFEEPIPKAKKEDKKEVKSKSKIRDISKGPIILDGLKSRPTKIQTLPSTNQQIKVFKINRSEARTGSSDNLKPKLHRIKFSKTPESKPFFQTEKKELTQKEKLTKTYLNAVNEVVQIVRKKRSIENKKKKEQEKLERQRRKDEKKARKQLEKEQREKESNELEEIVAKGPPYPPDLKLTKSGKPKKPYRRWTKEEMEEREKLAAEELLKPKKIKKVKKKKDKKPKKIPLSTLRKIPLFNLSKGLSPLMASLNYLADGKSTKKSSKTPSLGANNMSSEELALNAAKNQANASNITYYEPLLDSIVRKEIIELHPPWAVPEFPPYALPIVTLLKRDAIDKLIPHQKVHKKTISQPRVPSSKEKLITTILGPIVNTLKAAAKAKTASGATPEEASRYLATIIQYTKNTIVKALLNAKSSEVKKVKVEPTANRSMESENDVIPVIPIFNSRKIGANISKENSPTAFSKSTSQPTSEAFQTKTNDKLPVVKIENEFPSQLPKSPLVNSIEKGVTTTDEQNNTENTSNPYLKEFEPIGSKQELPFLTDSDYTESLTSQISNRKNEGSAILITDEDTKHFQVDTTEKSINKQQSVDDSNIDPNLTSIENVDPELRNDAVNANENIDSDSKSHGIEIIAVSDKPISTSKEGNDTYVNPGMDKSPVKYKALVDHTGDLPTDNEKHWNVEQQEIITASNTDDPDTSFTEENNTASNDIIINSHGKRPSEDSELEMETRQKNNMEPSINTSLVKKIKTDSSNEQIFGNKLAGQNARTNSLVQKLVRERLSDSNEDSNNSEGISDLTELISKTLSSVLPEIERKASEKVVKRPRKHTPNNVLNLDGLVPPMRKIIKREPNFKDPKAMTKSSPIESLEPEKVSILGPSKVSKVQLEGSYNKESKPEDSVQSSESPKPVNANIEKDTIQQSTKTLSGNVNGNQTSNNTTMEGTSKENTDNSAEGLSNQEIPAKDIGVQSDESSKDDSKIIIKEEAPNSYQLKRIDISNGQSDNSINGNSKIIPTPLIKKEVVKDLKSIQNLPKIEFNIPELRKIPRMGTLVTKLIKKYLTEDEFKQFKRELNKERKRKWRVANSQRNWEHDLRSRIKKKANDIFGQANSDEKTQWIEREYNQRKIKDEVKQESESVNRTGNTAMSDEDSLQIIAVSMKKLDLARKIETEVQETVKEITENPPKRKKIPKDKTEMVN